jgi:penicillin-binding protein 1A
MSDQEKAAPDGEETEPGKAAEPVAPPSTPEPAAEAVTAPSPSLAERAQQARAALQDKLAPALAAGAAKTREGLSAARAHFGKARESVAAKIEIVRTRKSDAPPPIETAAPARRGMRRAAMWGGYAALAFSAIIAAFSIYVTWGIPSTDDVWSDTTNPSLTIVDRNGRVILREGAQNAPPVDLEKLPVYVPQAVIAIEDKRFYKHMGVDIGGLTRALWENVSAGRVVQGGSTLSQQLAKNLFLTNERTFRRKAQEIVLAFWLESKFSKEEILALYLSRVYFGAGAYGIEAAAERYFDKPAKQLTLPEAAMLAGLLKAPSRLNPAQQDTRAKARAKVVLDEMYSEGFIDAKRRDAAMKAPLQISRSNPAGNLGYFRNWIDPQLARIIGDQRDDFIVETTLDLDAQRAGEKAVEEIVAADGVKLNATQGALLGMDSDGGVRAMVGGRGFGDSQFNRTTQARRQPGSSFKFFIYLTAMERGLSPFSIRNDAPLTIGDWSPGNYNDEFFGAVPLTTAYAKSLNMVAISISNEVGLRNVVDTTKRLGVRSKIEPYRSLALGAQEMTLIELTAAYGAMSSGGYKLEPFGITKVKRANGRVLWERRSDRVRVIEDKPLKLTNLLMKRVVDAGTGTRARIAGRDVGGKTGTGNDYRDAWFVGYVPGMVAGVWVGNDNFAETKKVTGGSLPARIWKDYMEVALRDTPAKPLPLPGPGDFPVVAVAPLEAVAPVETLTSETGDGAPAESPPELEEVVTTIGPPAG